MSVTKTVFIITTTDTEYTAPGDWTAQQIKDMYASQVQGISTMDATETYEDDGATRVLTFKPKTGNKG